MTHSRLKRLLASVLAAAMVLSLSVSGTYAVESDSRIPVSFEEMDPDEVSAERMNSQSPIEEGSSFHADNDPVRVTIVLEQASALTTQGLEAAASSDYRRSLKASQDQLARRISQEVLDGQALDVIWNLTLAENAISANVPYGKLDAIAQLPGVKAVYLETRYIPMQADVRNVVAQEMTGAADVQAKSGYTGAGARIAVIDSGTDTDHQSFDSASFQYALALQAGRNGMSPEDYAASLELLDEQELSQALNQLNASQRYTGLTAQDLYLSSKLPFGFNYVDGTLDVTHDHDTQGEHGSHVAGIATANDYIPAADPAAVYDFNGDGSLGQADAQALMDYVVQGTEISHEEHADLSGNGSVSAYDVHLLLEQLANEVYYVSAEQTVGVSGVAPNAQLLTMKVFGVNGGAYSSDYMAAVEDAIVLGCDAVNLSLGAAYPGFDSAHETNPSDSAYVDGIMEELVQTGLVLCVAAGNSGNWADHDDAYQHLYTDEAGSAMISDPSTFPNSFAVASVDNVGAVREHETLFGGTWEPAIEVTPDGVNLPWTTLDPDGAGTTYDVVFLGDPSALLSGGTQTDDRIYAGSLSDFDGYDFTGKVVLVARGNDVYFSTKHEVAAAAGAAAVLIYNNVPGALSGTIEGSTATVPCGGLSMEDAQAIFSLCNKNEDGLYATTMKVTTGLHIDHGEDVQYPTMSDFSSWGTTGSLTIKPEITAPGGEIYSVNGLGSATDQYEVMSGTSMATPHVSGLTALMSQYIREHDLLAKARSVTGNEAFTARALAQSLLMSTAQPLVEEASGVEYSVRNQGAGLANIRNAVNAQSFLLVDGQPDGKVKAELGDGDQGWSFAFTLYNLTGNALTYDLDASILTTDTLVAEDSGKTYNLTADEMVALGAEVAYTGETVNGNQVTLPAGGSTKVTVSIRVTEQAAENMKALGYDNGFYVEGYVYARPVASAEGVTGITHSIPLLGWYGSWSDPSMFDTGSYLETIYGTAQRPSHINAEIKNVFAWSPAGDDSGYAYTGNVYGYYDSTIGLVGDQHYFPERNAVNSTSDAAWSLYAILPTLMRNAADIMVSVTNTETGEVYYQDDYEFMDDYMISCFYYDLAGQWMDTTSDYGVGIEWDGTDPATGEALAEDTPITVSLYCAPEYYVDENGLVDWSQVGIGTELSFDFTIDNTAPTLSGGKDALTISRDGQTLYYTAQDNRYVAAVLLLDGAATTVVEYDYPDMPVKDLGKAVSGGFDLKAYREQYGNKAVIAVCDYAGNETYYAINLGGEGAPYGDLLAFQYNFWQGTCSWVAFNEDVSESESQLFASQEKFVCAEYLNGYVLAQSESGKLYAIAYEDILADSVDLESTYVASLENVYQDLAYSYAEGTMYGLVVEDAGSYLESAVYSINMMGTYLNEYEEEVAAYQEDWVMSRGGVYALALACDDEGSLYMLANATEETEENSTAQLWKAGLETDWSGTYMGAFQLVGDTGLEMDYLQSMTWDHNTESLYWARFCPTSTLSWESTLEKIDPDTAQCTTVGSLTDETCCLMAPLSAEAAAKEEHANVPAFDSSIVGTPIINQSIMTMNLGSTVTMSYQMDPWWTAHKDVVWSSSDETVATVSETGLVTAVDNGTCTITVAAKDDPSKFTTCAVTVTALDLKIEGIVSTQGATTGEVSGGSLYEYTMEAGVPTLNIQDAVTYPEEFQNYGSSLAASAYGRGSLWACEYGNSGMIYEIDPETGVVKDMLNPIDGDVMFGMSYSETTDRFNAIMNYYLFVDQPFTHEAEEEIGESYDDDLKQFTWHRFDLSEYLAASNRNFNTGETGNGSIVDVVFCGITTIEGGEPQELTSDFLGNYAMSGGATYTPTITLVLLDNVGRLWYIDEVVGMNLVTDDWGNSYYADSNNTMMIPSDFYGAFVQDYEDGTSNVFVIRELAETPMHDMYLAGTMPRITYHFSDLHYSESEDGRDMFFVSMYDYWNNGTTNQFYLYLPGVGTGKYAYDENWNRYEIKTPDVLYDIGTSGEHNIIATIHHAEVTGGLPELDTTADVLHPLYMSFYKG